MKDTKKTLLIQEDEYSLPYHWMQERNLALLSRTRAEIVLRFAGDLRGASVLDFGCGDGKFSALLSERGPSFLAGVDISEKAVEFAKKHIPAGSFTALTQPPLPFPDNTFDAVFSLDVIEHIPDSDAATWKKELLRVLKPGGKLLITVPSKTKNLDPKHFRHYSPEELTAFFSPECTGFSLQGYFKRLPLVPVRLLDLIYNRRFLWPLFSPLMKECPLEEALYLTMRGEKK